MCVGGCCDAELSPDNPPIQSSSCSHFLCQACLDQLFEEQQARGNDKPSVPCYRQGCRAPHAYFAKRRPINLVAIQMIHSLYFHDDDRAEIVQLVQQAAAKACRAADRLAASNAANAALMAEDSDQLRATVARVVGHAEDALTAFGMTSDPVQRGDIAASYAELIDAAEHAALESLQAQTAMTDRTVPLPGPRTQLRSQRPSSASVTAVSKAEEGAATALSAARNAAIAAAYAKTECELVVRRHEAMTKRKRQTDPAMTQDQAVDSTRAAAAAPAAAAASRVRDDEPSTNPYSEHHTLLPMWQQIAQQRIQMEDMIATTWQNYQDYESDSESEPESEPETPRNNAAGVARAVDAAKATAEHTAKAAARNERSVATTADPAPRKRQKYELWHDHVQQELTQERMQLPINQQKRVASREQPLDDAEKKRQLFSIVYGLPRGRAHSARQSSEVGLARVRNSQLKEPPPQSSKATSSRRDYPVRDIDSASTGMMDLKPAAKEHVMPAKRTNNTREESVMELATPPSTTVVAAAAAATGDHAEAPDTAWYWKQVIAEGQEQNSVLAALAKHNQQHEGGWLRKKEGRQSEGKTRLNEAERALVRDLCRVLHIPGNSAVRHIAQAWGVSSLTVNNIEKDLKSSQVPKLKQGEQEYHHPRSLSAPPKLRQDRMNESDLPEQPSIGSHSAPQKGQPVDELLAPICYATLDKMVAERQRRSVEGISDPAPVPAFVRLHGKEHAAEILQIVATTGCAKVRVSFGQSTRIMDVRPDQFRLPGRNYIDFIGNPDSADWLLKCLGSPLQRPSRPPCQEHYQQPQATVPTMAALPPAGNLAAPALLSVKAAPPAVATLAAPGTLLWVSVRKDEYKAKLVKYNLNANTATIIWDDRGEEATVNIEQLGMPVADCTRGSRKRTPTNYFTVSSEERVPRSVC